MDDFVQVKCLYKGSISVVYHVVVCVRVHVETVFLCVVDLTRAFSPSFFLQDKRTGITLALKVRGECSGLFVFEGSPDQALGFDLQGYRKKRLNEMVRMTEAC